MEHNNKLSAYTSAAQTVRKTRQVVMLYDGAIRFIQQAKQAILNNDIETRYNALERVSAIITGLQASLDFEKGGQLAKTLYDYYAGMDMRLMSLHSKPDPIACDQVVKHLRMMREAWEEVDKRTSEHPGTHGEDEGARGESTALSEDNDAMINFGDPHLARSFEAAAANICLSA